MVYILEVSQNSTYTHQAHSYTHVLFPGTATGADPALDPDLERLDVLQKRLMSLRSCGQRQSRARQTILSLSHFAMLITLLTFLFLGYSMGGREASLDAKAKAGISDVKAEAEGIAARAETLAADAKAKTGQVVEKVKGKLS